MKTFYKKRAVALFPLMDLMFVTFYVIYSVLVHNFRYGGALWKWPLSLIGVDSYLGFYGIGTYAVVGEWFTAIILIDYLLFPLLRFLYKQHFCLTTAVLTILYFANVFWDLQGGVKPDVCVTTGIFLFWVGMMLFHFREQAEHNLLWLAAGILAAVLVVFVKLPVFPGRGSSLPWKDLLGLSLFIIMLQIFSFIPEKGEVKRTCRFLAGLSFGVYLCHHFIIYRLQAIMTAWIGGEVPKAWAGYLLLLIFSAAVSFIFQKTLMFIQVRTQRNR